MGLFDGLFGGLLGLFGTMDTNETNTQNARERNFLEYQIHQEDNAFNASEAAKNRDFTSAEAATAYERQRALNQEERAFNASEAQKAREFEEMMYQRYESPEAVAGALERAGINPAAVMSGSNGSVGTVGAPSAGAGSAPLASGSAASSVGTPNMVVPQIDNPMLNFVASMSQMQQSLESASRTSLNSIDIRTRDNKNLAELNRMKAAAENDLASGKLSAEKTEETKRNIERLDNEISVLKQTMGARIDDITYASQIRAETYKQAVVDTQMKEFEKVCQPLFLELQAQKDEATIASLRAGARAALITAFSTSRDSETRSQSLKFDMDKWEGTMKDVFEKQRDETEKKIELLEQQKKKEGANVEKIEAEIAILRDQLDYNSQSNTRSWIDTIGKNINNFIDAAIPF